MKKSKSAQLDFLDAIIDAHAEGRSRVLFHTQYEVNTQIKIRHIDYVAKRVGPQSYLIEVGNGKEDDKNRTDSMETTVYAED